MVEDNYYWYLANQAELVKKYDGKHLVLSGCTVAGAYDTRRDAYVSGANNYGLGNFLIQKCSPGDKDTTVRIYSPYFKVKESAR
jgi:hypothetical protein